MTTADGPPLEALVHRLAETPAEFLLKPLALPGGVVDIAAVVCDQLRAMGMSAPDAEQARKRFTAHKPADENRVRLISVATWLLHDEWFLARPALATAVWKLLSDGLDAMARVVPAPAAVSDPDRREELARLCLRHLGLRPAGETAAQAADRLNTLDSVERDRVVRQTRAAEERTRQIREAMAAKAAQEAASRYSPE